MSGEGKVVCVTGASGYVASWLVKLLLLRRYTVKATVRHLSDPKKVAHLKALEGAEQRLQLFEANLIEDGSFDSVVDGCDCVFHTASPCFFEAADPQAELIKPAVEGTLNVLRSCAKVPSLRRVVVTSSTSAVIMNRNPKGPDVLVDETWFSDPAYCEEIKMWYPLSKTLAEQAAWKFAEENSIDLVVMNPGFVLGPLLQSTLNFSSGVILDIMKGKEVFPSYRFVDVRDVVYAHIMAFENTSASGRYCIVGKAATHSEAMQVLHELYPSITGPVSGTATGSSTYQISKKKALSLGVNFMALEVSLKDTVESLVEKNFLTL